MAERIISLKKRAEFLSLRHSPSYGRRGFLLVRGYAGSSRSCNSDFLPYSQNDAPNAAATIRVGYTVTKKMGNAVRRNRIRRRLKAAFSCAAPLIRGDNADYVVIARPAAFDQPFDVLCRDMKEALTALRKGRHKGRS